MGEFASSGLDILVISTDFLQMRCQTKEQSSINELCISYLYTIANCSVTKTDRFLFQLVLLPMIRNKIYECKCRNITFRFLTDT